MKSRYGYCCINLSLADDGITTNRGMVKKTFDQRGLAYASELALKNSRDLLKVVEWNKQNGIGMYRMSSDIFPWCSEYELKDLPDYEEICEIFINIGTLAKESKIRLTFHPSPYAVLASHNPNVVKKAVKEISQHAEIMDLLGLPRDHNSPINIHVNSSNPDKKTAAERFCENFSLLPDSAKARLVVEVDDKKSQFTSIDLYEMVYKKVGVPITFDYLHNYCNPPEGLSEKESLEICLSTWPVGILPITHYSDSKKLFEDETSKLNAHTDWIWQTPETYGHNFYTEFEVKKKDLAVLKFLTEKNLQ
jgi:UV DNA damage endonuclease